MEPRATRQLTFHGAVVTLVGLLAGIPYAMVATERMPGSERAWRFAHAGNILGGLVLIAVAGVADRLDLVPARRSLLVWSLVLGAYADALGIVAAATFDVRGLIPGGSLAKHRGVRTARVRRGRRARRRGVAGARGTRPAG